MSATFNEISTKLSSKNPTSSSSYSIFIFTSIDCKISLKSDSANFPVHKKICISSSMFVFPILFSPIRKFIVLSNLIVRPERFL